MERSESGRNSDASTANNAISDNFGKNNIYGCTECKYKAISVWPILRESGAASQNRSLGQPGVSRSKTRAGLYYHVYKMVGLV